MRCRLAFSALGFLTVVGCATTTRLDGASEGVAWRATDLRLERQTVRGESRMVYAFNLVLRDTSGHGATFTRLDYILYQPGMGGPSHGNDQGSWVLPANGEITFPFSSYIMNCPMPGECIYAPQDAPLWDVTLRGKDGRGRDVIFKANVVLPGHPMSPKD